MNDILTQNNAQQPYSTPSQPYEIPTSPYNGPVSSYRPPEPVVRDPLYGLVPAARAPPALTLREQPQSQQSNLLTHPPPTQHYTIQVTERAPEPVPQKTQHETRSRGWFSGLFRRTEMMMAPPTILGLRIKRTTTASDGSSRAETRGPSTGAPHQRPSSSLLKSRTS